MMSLERPAISRFAPAALRWSLAALIVAGAHGTAGWVIANWQRAEAAMGAPPAAVMIELSPLAVAPETPPQEVAPGPEMTEAQPEPEPPPPEPVETPSEIEPPPEPEPVAVPELDIPIPELPPLPDALAVLTPPPKEEAKPPPPEVKPRPKPKPRVVEKKKPVRPDKPKAEQTTAPVAQAQAAPRAAAPASGASSPSPAATASWRGSLMAHLNRYKRFPGGASPGTVQVAFSIDRGGRVLSARLLRGSGDAALDGEAVAMIRRASPVPAPPEGVGGSAIALAVPIRFSR
ncbi:energy transducer TonB [Bosea sp. (in: a-proteobacteria)]|uniref:energy transducer TonB family protein n=1 Tax=Bosea sp. (in: a-proteobacteria) TaxID=1871050 RepID=UPI00262FDDFF|nr:energy transducer TonB [Bosea sp. (in: a-proteobacteria)]MCO5093294.1 TonB family protein [Bosea sp. (in: a-proteobacteria)]